MLALKVLSRVSAFAGTNDDLAKEAGFSRSSIATALKSLKQRGEIYIWTKHRKRGLTFVSPLRVVYFVSKVEPDDGARMLVSWIREKGASKAYRYADQNVICGRLRCSPKQLEAWLEVGKRDGFLAGGTAAPTQDEQPESSSDNHRLRPRPMYIAIKGSGVRGIPLPKSFSKVGLRLDGSYFNDPVDLDIPSRSIRKRLFIVLADLMEEHGVTTASDAALASRVRASRSSVQEHLAAMTHECRLYRYGKRPRLLSFQPMTEEEVRAEIAYRRRRPVRKPSPRRPGRPRKHLPEFSIGEVRTAIIDALIDRRQEPPDPETIVLSRAQIREAVVAQTNALHLSRDVLLLMIAGHFADSGLFIAPRRCPAPMSELHLDLPEVPWAKADAPTDDLALAVPATDASPAPTAGEFRLNLVAPWATRLRE